MADPDPECGWGPMPGIVTTQVLMTQQQIDDFIATTGFDPTVNEPKEELLCPVGQYFDFKTGLCVQEPDLGDLEESPRGPGVSQQGITLSSGDSYIGPTKQMDAGVLPIKVLCNEGKERLIKTSDGSAVCVSPETAERLIERGWATR